MSRSPKISGAQATCEALDQALSIDASVILLGEDIADREGGGVVKATAGLSTRHGTARVRSTPISEQAIAGAAVGAAIAGMRPVAEIMMMNFITVAMDQIVNHAAKIRYMSGGRTTVPLTIRTMSGAGGGFGGQHSDMLEAWLAHVPGLKVVIPSNPADQKGLLLSCIFDEDPCIFVESTLLMGMKGPVPEDDVRVPLGRANIVRNGSDVTIIAYGRPVHDALAAAEELAAQGISVEIVDLRTIVPMDMETVLESVSRTRRAVVVHEAVEAFGVGAEIVARLQSNLFDSLAAPVSRVASRNTPVPFSRPLEESFMWSRQRIVEAVGAAVEYRRQA